MVHELTLCICHNYAHVLINKEKIQSLSHRLYTVKSNLRGAHRQYMYNSIRHAVVFCVSFVIFKLNILWKAHVSESKTCRTCNVSMHNLNVFCLFHFSAWLLSVICRRLQGCRVSPQKDGSRTSSCCHKQRFSFSISKTCLS